MTGRVQQKDKLMKKLILLLFLFSLFLVACGNNPVQNGQSPSPAPANGGGEPEYRRISAEEAYQMMQDADDYILLDVRRVDEFNEEHIERAVLIPYDEIENRAAEELPDKNALILVYCRSGRRSETAARALVSMGYTNVYDFGGILDWPFETVGG